jgi:nitroreductase
VTAGPGEEVMRAIATRRSVSRVRPDPPPRALVEEVVHAALHAPNHHATAPWRLVVMTGDARSAISPRLERAPVVVACCVVTGDDPVTAREDRDAVAAGVQNLLLAAHARGLAAMWRTGTMVDEPDVREALGLGPHDAVVAFVYLGLPLEDAPAAAPREPDGSGSVVWRGW